MLFPPLDGFLCLESRGTLITINVSPQCCDHVSLICSHCNIPKLSDGQDHILSIVRPNYRSVISFHIEQYSIPCACSKDTQDASMQQFCTLPLISLPSPSDCLVQIHMVSPLLFFLFSPDYAGSQFQHKGSSFLTADQTQGPYTGSTESQPLDHQGHPSPVLLSHLI